MDTSIALRHENKAFLRDWREEEERGRKDVRKRMSVLVALAGKILDDAGGKDFEYTTSREIELRALRKAFGMTWREHCSNCHEKGSLIAPNLANQIYIMYNAKYNKDPPWQVAKI